MTFSDWSKELLAEMQSIGMSAFRGCPPILDAKLAWERGLSVREAALAFLGMDAGLFQELKEASKRSAW